MSNNISEELDREIKAFLEKSDNMNSQDKLDALRNLFVKHMQLEESCYIMDNHNLFNIVSGAKNVFANDLPTTVSIQGKKVQYEEKRIISVISATIGELRRIKTLRKVVKFKFDDKC